MQIQDENGSYIVSDDFEVKMDEQFKQFSMNLYQGSLSAEYVTAEIKIGDKGIRIRYPSQRMLRLQ